jgi:hypothetical protein
MMHQHAGTVAHLSRHFPGFTRRVLVPGAGLAGLGFSLKPPAWLRNVAGQIVSGSKVSVPSVTVPLPGGGSVTTPGTRTSFPEQAQQAVESIPGGWFTVAAVGLGAILLMQNARR